MNTGQTMLVIGAFTLLSALTLAINCTILSSASLGYQMEANLNALSLGQSLLDEVMTRDFDEAVTNDRRVYKYSAMTPVANLGPDGAEAIGHVDSSYTGVYLSQTRFDDVDDYHNYTRKAWDTRLGWFTLRVTIAYIDETNPNNPAPNPPSWQKCITVSITNYSMPLDANGNPLVYTLKDIAVYRKYF